MDYYELKEKLEAGGNFSRLVKGTEKRKASMALAKSGVFERFKLIALFELMLSGESKALKATGFSKQNFRTWFNKMFVLTPYTTAVKTNHLGVLADYVRSHRDQKEMVLSYLMREENGVTQFEKIIKTYDGSPVDCYTDKLMGSRSYTDSLYQFDDDWDSPMEKPLDDVDEVDEICRDFFADTLDNVPMDRILGLARNLCPQGYLYSVTDSISFRNALGDLDPGDRVVILLHYRDGKEVEFNDLWVAKFRLEKLLQRELEGLT